jgi:hypothetical protein
MMKGLRIAIEKVRLLAALGFGIGAACVLVPGTSAAFSASSLTGGYGCLGHATTSDSSGTLSGLSEVMRLTFDGAGHATGKIVLNLSGEVCLVVTTGTYSVNFGGLGQMDLTWVSATGDADGDALCSSLGGLGVAQHTTLVVEHGGGEFDIQSADDFLTESGHANDTLTGLSDLSNPFVGSCKKQ